MLGRMRFSGTLQLMILIIPASRGNVDWELVIVNFATGSTFNEIITSFQIIQNISRAK